MKKEEETIFAIIQRDGKLVPAMTKRFLDASPDEMARIVFWLEAAKNALLEFHRDDIDEMLIVSSSAHQRRINE